MSIALMTFDIFGTVLDWRTGLFGLTDDQFERAIDRQGALEQGSWRSYTEIVAQSLIEVAGLNAVMAAGFGAQAGNWPLFADSAEALRKLRAVAPCAAITNSDREHGEQVQAQLGFRLDGWVCAEEARAYKPDRKMWEAASRKLGVPFSKDWWHVSAYADYDHAAARALGLTCVHVKRPHSRPGPADLIVSDLAELVIKAG
ncbi:MAG TPA: HAD family hydrolase [Myxococcales bacterium]|nr:HAD family hydrolase [Myxococcales bacterium]